jgi:hypothetical protein
MRKAIQQFDESRDSDGLTKSRYPAAVPQVIPPYSLSWVEMVGDYWMHRPNTAFVHERLRGVRSVLDWYNRQLMPNGLIGPTLYWNFVDWSPEWPWNSKVGHGGVPDLEGGSSIISLQYLGALYTAEKLHRFFGEEHQADIYRARAKALATAVRKLCWNAERQLYSDTPAGTSFSQHANILAILTDIAPATAPKLLEKVLIDGSLTQVTQYFRFYLIQALYHTGRGDLYPEELGLWQGYLDQGFTTWPEKPGESRSDCHAWSASPNYDLLATLAGIRPASPGFQTVSIRPAYTEIDYRAIVPHPKGVISVKKQGNGKDSYFEIQLPEGVNGLFSMEGHDHQLKGGSNKVTVGHK